MGACHPSRCEAAMQWVPDAGHGPWIAAAALALAPRQQACAWCLRPGDRGPAPPLPRAGQGLSRSRSPGMKVGRAPGGRADGGSEGQGQGRPLLWTHVWSHPSPPPLARWGLVFWNDRGSSSLGAIPPDCVPALSTLFLRENAQEVEEQGLPPAFAVQWSQLTWGAQPPLWEPPPQAQVPEEACTAASMAGRLPGAAGGRRPGGLSRTRLPAA